MYSDLEYMPISEFSDVNPPTGTGSLLPDSRVSFIPMADVSGEGEWVSHQTRRLKEVEQGYTSFRENDILFAKITPCTENGKGAHAMSLVNGIGFGSTEFHVLRPKHPDSGRYLFHWSQFETLRLKAASVMIGSAGQQRVPEWFFDEFTIPVFSLPEQRRIAEILDTADEAIRQTERLIAKLKLVKAGLLHDLLTRGLDEGGHLRDPQAHPEQFKDSPLGRVPREWQVTTLGDVISGLGGLIQTGPFGSQLHAEEYTKEGIPVVMPQDIQGSHISIELIARIPPQRAETLSRHRVAPNDVVFARRGDLSRCAPIGKREECWLCGTGCLLVRPPTEVINGRWLAAIYQHDQCQRQIAARAVGSTMVNLNTSLLSSLVIAKPSYDEQVSIVEAINAHGDHIRAEEAALGKLRQVKRGLMDDLLTGRVRV